MGVRVPSRVLINQVKQLKQLIEALVIEGKLEKEATETSRLIINALKQKLIKTNGFKKQFKFSIDAPDLIDVSKIHVYVKNFADVGSYIQAYFYSDKDKLQNNRIQVVFGLPKLDFDSIMQKMPHLVADLKDSLRHEFEHTKQSASDIERIKGYDLSSVEDVIRYCLDPAEISAHVAGMYKQAKMRKIHLSDVFSERQTEIMRIARDAGADARGAQAIAQATLEAWVSYAKKKFPSAIV